MKKICFFIVFLSLISLSVTAQKNNYEKLLTQLDVMVPSQMKEWNVAGVAIGVVYKDKLVYAKGFGYRDVQKKLLVTTETSFRIGSNTKAFTAAIIGILAEKDKKNYLDESIRNFMPELQFKDEFANSRATARDLMSHRTGLSRSAEWGSFSDFDSVYLRVSSVPPQAPFRTQYIYNNTMFIALGKLSENLTGKKWGTNLRELILDPLGMTHSGSNTEDWLKNENRSMGYTIAKGSIVPGMRDSATFGPFASGSMISNIPELTHWVSTWINGGKYNGKQVIPESYYKQAISAHNNILPSFDPSRPELQLNSYGLGFDLVSYRGHYLVYHGGRVGGFTTNVSFMPQDSLGVIVLINQNSSPLYYNLMYSIYDRLLKLPAVDWNGRERNKRNTDTLNVQNIKKQDSLERKLNTKPTLPLSEYTGTYFHAGAGYLRIHLEKEKLVSQYNRGIRIGLDHYHHDIFYAPAMDPTVFGKYNFILNEKGKVHNVSYTEPVSKIELVFSRQ